MKKKLLIFDIDDTLTKSAFLHQLAFTESLYELGVKEIDTNFGEYLHHTDSYISRVIFEKDRNTSFSEESATQFEALLFAKVSALEIPEIRGAQEFIQQIEQLSNIAVVFATGSLRRPAIYKLNSIGVDFNSELLVASDQIPERENIVKVAIESAKKVYDCNDFENIISFGDGVWDLKTAQNLAIEFIGIGDRNKTVLIENGCQKHFSNFEGINIEEL